jgi:hypothetical protein
MLLCMLLIWVFLLYNIFGRRSHDYDIWNSTYLIMQLVQLTTVRGVLNATFSDYIC